MDGDKNEIEFYTGIIKAFDEIENVVLNIVKENDRRAINASEAITQAIDDYLKERERYGKEIETPTPEELAALMRALSEMGDKEDRHRAMDNVFCDVLEKLGYSEAVDIFHSTSKWYA